MKNFFVKRSVRLRTFVRCYIRNITVFAQKDFAVYAHSKWNMLLLFFLNELGLLGIVVILHISPYTFYSMVDIFFFTWSVLDFTIISFLYIIRFIFYSFNELCYLGSFFGPFGTTPPLPLSAYIGQPKKG